MPVEIEVKQLVTSATRSPKPATFGSLWRCRRSPHQLCSVKPGTFTSPEMHRVAEHRVGTGGPKSGSRPGRAPLSECSRPPSFAAFLTDTFFLGDVSIALAAPLVMLGSIARSLDPRVGGAFDQPLMTNPVCAAHQLPEAREDFPYGTRAVLQVLHVARHVVWYALVRPARNGDWAGLLLNVMNVVYPCTLLLVAVSPRTGRVWGWWRRHRLSFVSTTVVLSRCVLLVCTFLLLPPATWPTHTWAGYVVSASRRPLSNALALSVYDQFAKVPLTAVAVHALAQTAAVFLMAYIVAPTIVAIQHQQRQLLLNTGTSSCAAPAPASTSTAPVPLQCGLRPEHSALLPCRPLALQVLLGLAMAAWPVWLSWAVERRLRRRYAELCTAWRRKQLEQQHELQAPVPDSTTGLQDQQQHHQQRNLQDGSIVAPSALRPHCSGSAFDSVGCAPWGQGSKVGRAIVPAGPVTAATTAAAATAAAFDAGGGRHSGQPLSSGASAALTPIANARYRSTRITVMAAVKVQEHPGSFEAYGNHLASLLHTAVREYLTSAAEPAKHTTAAGVPVGVDTLPSRGAAPRRARAAATADAILHTAVVRGCVQAVLWGWVTEGAGGGAEGDAVAAQRLLQRLAECLEDPGLAGAGTGGVRGVSVQVGQAVAVWQVAGGLARDGEHLLGDQEEVQAGQADATSTQWPSSSGAAWLLKMDPPAASLPAAGAAASGPLAVRLLLHSPAPQPARVLVLAERQGRGGAVPPRAVLLREVAVALEGGVQEVEVEVGAGELAEAVEGGGLPGGVGVLRIMMVGPVHVSQDAGSGQQVGPHPPRPVHWVAPPLLLLPEEAVGELCGLWEQMKWEQEGEEGEQQKQKQAQGQEHPNQATRTSALPLSASPTGPAAALAGVKQESSLWWFHMATLMGDLACALSAWHGWQDRESEDVVRQLLEFLYSNGLPHTAAMLLQPSCCNSPDAAVMLSYPSGSTLADQPLCVSGHCCPTLPCSTAAADLVSIARGSALATTATTITHVDTAAPYQRA